MRLVDNAGVSARQIRNVQAELCDLMQSLFMRSRDSVDMLNVLQVTRRMMHLFHD